MSRSSGPRPSEPVARPGGSRRSRRSTPTARRTSAAERRSADPADQPDPGHPASHHGMTDDRALIRDLVENWAVWRDAGDWERFATVWHDDGCMMATWFQGPADEFIRVSREGFERGVSILHFLGGDLDRSGRRSRDRADQDDHLAAGRGRRRASATSSAPGRFYDFLEQPRTAGGGSCCASRSMRRTGSTRSTPPRGSSSTPSCWRAFRSATATSPTCRRRSVSQSSPICPG